MFGKHNEKKGFFPDDPVQMSTRAIIQYSLSKASFLNWDVDSS